MSVPNFLFPIADNIKEKDTTTTLNLKCSCNCPNFLLYKNKESNTEQIKRLKWEQLLQEYNGGGYSDSEGNLFLTKKKIFCIKPKGIKINKHDIPKYLIILKAKCSSCGKEYIIFDNCKNGYDAISHNTITDDSNKNQKTVEYKSLNKKPTHIKIKITNDMTYSNFLEEFPGATLEKYLNAFSNISVYLLKNNKFILVFSKETR